jgi:hypothetical protein
MTTTTATEKCPATAEMGPADDPIRFECDLPAHEGSWHHDPVRGAWRNS